MKAPVPSDAGRTLAFVVGVPVGAVLAACLVACGTASPRPAPAPIVMPVPVHEPCVRDEPAVPAWAVSALRTGQPIGEQVKALMVERAQRIAYESRLLAVIEGCR